MPSDTTPLLLVVPADLALLVLVGLRETYFHAHPDHPAQLGSPAQFTAAAALYDQVLTIVQDAARPRVPVAVCLRCAAPLGATARGDYCSDGCHDRAALARAETHSAEAARLRRHATELLRRPRDRVA
jgi:hypothetical protein